MPAIGSASETRRRISVEDTSKGRPSMRTARAPGGIADGAHPGRAKTANSTSLNSASASNQRPSPGTESSPIMKNSSAQGSAAFISRTVSTARETPPLSISAAHGLNRGSAAHARRTISNLSAHDAHGAERVLKGETAAGTNRTSSSAAQSAAARAMPTCPECTGSNDPPNMPSRFIAAGSGRLWKDSRGRRSCRHGATARRPARG